MVRIIVIVRARRGDFVPGEALNMCANLSPILYLHPSLPPVAAVKLEAETILSFISI